MRPTLTLLALACIAVLASFGCTPQADGGAATSPTPDATATNNVRVTGTDDDQEHNIVGDSDDDEPGDDDGEDLQGKEDDDEDDDSVEDKKDERKGETKTTSNPQQPSMKLTVYRNAAGKLVCPVMDAPIESEDKAFSFADWKGKRYYFCCDGCPKVFDKNKDTYAK